MIIGEFEVKIYKMGNGYIQVRYLDPKTGKRKRKRVSTLREAKVYKQQVENRVNLQGVHTFNDLRVAQAMKDYIEKFPSSQIRSRGNHFKSFINKFGTYRVNTITTSDLQEWMEKSQRLSDLSDRTMNLVKTQFNSFFKYLKKENYITHNPISEVRFKYSNNPRRKRVILSVEEVKKALENAKKFSPHILYPYLACVAHTGARKGEVMRLDRQDIDFQTVLIHLRETKNGQERFVRISPMLKEVLKTQIESHSYEPLLINEESQRLHRSQLARLMDKFKAFFPIGKNWGSHSLRHSFAYNFLKKGGQMYQLQAILGHKSIGMTVDLYGQLQAQDIENPSPYEYEEHI